MWIAIKLYLEGKGSSVEIDREVIDAKEVNEKKVSIIKGIVYLGKRHLLSDWREEFKNDKAAVVRIEKYQELYRYAMEINEFQETTEISLGALRRNVSGFVAPQMYIYLDGTELLDYIENKIEKLDGCTVHDYSVIKSNEVCVH